MVSDWIVVILGETNGDKITYGTQALCRAQVVGSGQNWNIYFTRSWCWLYR